MLSLIGENYKYGDTICGIVFSNRKSCFRIALWIKPTKSEEEIMDIGFVYYYYYYCYKYIHIYVYNNL